MEANHVHDCTGPDARCPCGWKFTVPPVWAQIENGRDREALLAEAFNCETVEAAIEFIEGYLKRLKATL